MDKRVVELTNILLNRIPPSKVHIVEVGTYMGNTAVGILKILQNNKYTPTYTGFDLFENMAKKKELKVTNPGIYKRINAADKNTVLNAIQVKKVRDKLNNNGFGSISTLIKGNTKNTIPRNSNEIRKAAFVYIDGGHDYQSVSTDWCNIQLFGSKGTIVVFDDTHTHGVGKLIKEIADDGYLPKRSYGNRAFVIL